MVTQTQRSDWFVSLPADDTVESHSEGTSPTPECCRPAAISHLPDATTSEKGGRDGALRSTWNNIYLDDNLVEFSSVLSLKYACTKYIGACAEDLSVWGRV